MSKWERRGGGQAATVIAWIWARTVKCPNPVCGCEMPLAGSFVLSKKAGHEAYIQPVIDKGSIRYEVKYGKNAPEAPKTARGKFRCICCGEPVQSEYIKAEGKKKQIGATLLAIVAEESKGRLYLSANFEQSQVAQCGPPPWTPEGELIGKSADQLPLYGFNKFSELFTNRQLTALTTFSDLVAESQKKRRQTPKRLDSRTTKFPLLTEVPAQWHTDRPWGYIWRSLLIK